MDLKENTIVIVVVFFVTSLLVIIIFRLNEFLLTMLVNIRFTTVDQSLVETRI